MLSVQLLSVDSKFPSMYTFKYKTDRTVSPRAVQQQKIFIFICLKKDNYVPHKQKHGKYYNSFVPLADFRFPLDPVFYQGGTFY